MKSWMRNISVGLACVAVFIGIAIYFYSSLLTPKTDVLKIPDSAERAEVIYAGETYDVDEEKFEELSVFIKELEVVKNGQETNFQETRGIIVRIFDGETEVAKFYVKDENTILDYEKYEEKGIIEEYRTETNLIEYFSGLTAVLDFEES